MISNFRMDSKKAKMEDTMSWGEMKQQVLELSKDPDISPLELETHIRLLVSSQSMETFTEGLA